MTKICLVFRDTNSKLENYTVKFNIKETVLAKRWQELLIKNLFETDHPIEKTYCLQGWQTTWDSTYSRNVEFLCKKLNQAIKQINLEMAPKGYPFINLKFSIDVLKDRNKFRDHMNAIHHHFELLIGQVWKESLWYGKASEKTRMAIRMLNNYCHEIEKNVENIRTNTFIYKLTPFHLRSYVTVSLNGVNSKGKYFDWTNRKFQLTPEEHACFQDKSNWGSISIFYAQLGKTHMEAHSDKDEHIERNNISSHQLISGEFVVYFLPKKDEAMTREFKQWLIDNDYDINDKTLGIGYPAVAEIDMQGQTKKEVLKKLRARDDLFAIALEDAQGNQTHYKEYNYTWKDEEGWK